MTEIPSTFGPATRVAVFVSGSRTELEEGLNEWLRNNPVHVIDLKLATSSCQGVGGELGQTFITLVWFRLLEPIEPT